ncbi:hypothetical protein ACXET9_06930 [Brachybacterium sp. DNPG3]
MTPISDLQAVRAWWRTLGTDRTTTPTPSSPSSSPADVFIVLPPPTRSRYTQGDGHDDAAELFADRGLDAGTSYAFWSWQRHEVFDADGMLTGPLMLHWGGDHAAVRAGLGTGPEGFEILDGGPTGAFALDRIAVRDADGLPDPDDAAGVRRFLEELEEPLDRRRWHFAYRPLSAAEEGWLRARVADGLAAVAADPARIDDRALLGPLGILSLRDAVALDDARALLGPWRAVHGEDLAGWEGWAAVLRALARAEDPEAAVLARAIGFHAASVLVTVDRTSVLPVLRELVADGADAGDWLEAVVRVEGMSGLDALRRLGGEILAEGSELPDVPRTWESLARTLLRLEVSDTVLPDAPEAVRAELSWALDDSLPRPFRAQAAQRVRRRRSALESLAASEPRTGGDSGSDGTAADLRRFDAIVDELLAGAGPDLTDYYGTLVDLWHEYRVLSPADTAWLHAQVADPATAIQGLAFCLELLVSHGEGTTADVDALRRRWRKELAKTYDTTYVPWRHPLVSLTCLARELEDPLADALGTWWAKQPPKWKTPARLLTLLARPDEEGQRALEEVVAASDDDSGQLVTLILLTARREGARPIEVVDRMRADGRLREFEATALAVAVADPAQPLWRLHRFADDRGGWDRLVLIVDDAALSPELRRSALEQAQRHPVLRRSDDLEGMTAADLDAASAWFDDRAAAAGLRRDDDLAQDDDLEQDGDL